MSLLRSGIIGDMVLTALIVVVTTVLISSSTIDLGPRTPFPSPLVTSKEKWFGELHLGEHVGHETMLEN